MIGIIAAMDVERDAIEKRMTDLVKEETAGCTFGTGLLSGTKTVVVRCGIGKVNAAMAAAILCMKYNPDLIVSTGVAGGLDENMEPMDLVAADTAWQADYDTSPVDGIEGIGLEYEIDKDALDLLKTAAADAEIPLKIGGIATSDKFISRKEDYEFLKEYFPSAAAAEMEGAAAASVAKAFGIPCLLMRSLSDVIGHEGNEMEFEVFASKAAKRAADLMEVLALKVKE